MNPDTPSPPLPRRLLSRASLVLGVLGLLGLGPVAGLPAIVAGHVALRRTREQPSRHGGRGVAITGLTLGYVSLVAGLAVAVGWLSIVGPAMRRNRGGDEGTRCRQHLRELAVALRVHADDHDKRYPTNLVALGNDLIAPAHLACPADPAQGGYQLLRPGERRARSSDGAPLAACRVHGLRVRGDGTFE